MAEDKPELLAPCGSFAALTAAVEAGADAVYLGAKQFNARALARNFSDQELTDAIAYAHAHGVRVYAALNTQILDRELHDAVRTAWELRRAGADGLILSDLGLASLCRALMPDLVLHASTQLGAHNTDAMRFLSDFGFCRAVCARELRADEIRTLCKDSPIEIEVFVHGALCASQSGGCLFSSLVGGRSGNRGVCAQPCRLPYDRSYPLSLKDLCLAAHLTELCAAGVASLKIEGRMKGADYVGGVTGVYRTLLDEGKNADSARMAYLARLFSRSGFTDGYYTGTVDRSMLGVRTEADKAARPERLPPPDFAVRPPIRPTVHNDPFPDLLPKPQELFDRAAAVPGYRSARFYMADIIPRNDFFDIVYLPLEHYESRANGVLLPPVVFPRDEERVRQALERAKARGAKHLMITNIGQIRLARKSGMEIHFDYRFNLYNCYAAAFFARYGEILLSPELTLPQMRDIRTPKSAVVYGRIPLMTLERPTGRKVLTDRRGVRFPIIREGGREIVFNSVPVYMGDRADAIGRAEIGGRHFIFTTEDASAVREVIRAYETGAGWDGKFTRIKNK